MMFGGAHRFTASVLASLALVFLATEGQASLTAADATPTSVTLNWTAPGDDGTTGTASQYDIRYSLSTITDANWGAATQVTGEPAPGPAGTAQQFEVTGLQPSTTYYFAIKTADEVPNWSTLSNVVAKATLPEDSPPAVIANLSAGSPTATSLTLTWTAPGDDGSTGTAAQYDIRRSTSTITAANWSSATQITGEPAPRVAGSAESFVVTGLNPNTTYYFAMMTADEVPNWSGMSNVTSGTTSTETTPPSAIANLGAGAPTEHTIELSWTAPGDDGMAGTAAQYSIRYSTAFITEANFNAATPVASPPAPLAGGSFQSYVVTGLNSGTTYFFAIKTADEVPNWSAISNNATLSTSNDATAPSAVANLSLILPTTSSLTLIWTAPGDDGSIGTASQYDIRYSTSVITAANFASATQVTGEPLPRASGTPETLLVAGLTANTRYYFALKSADERTNWSAISNVPNNITAQDNTPPAPINDLVAVPGENNGEINLTWVAPGDDGMTGTATAYEIRYSLNNITSGNWGSALPWSSPPNPTPAGTAQSTTLSSLVPGETYYVGIKAYDDAANPAALSNVVSCEARFILVLNNGNLAQPTSPPPLAVLPTARPVLVVENADPSPDNVYRFELATDSNFFGLVAGGVVDQHIGTTTSWQVNLPLVSEQQYFWRVATNTDGYSETSSFFVDPYAHAYPNPVRFSEVDAATFTDLPADGELLLTSISGSIIRRWTNLVGQDIVWDGTNESGNRVASGTYLWFLPDSGAQGKLIVIN
ncbi:MAG: fibronectin type III domain-containing protein [Candidatus Zixiibacteriota bacterium]